MIRDAIIGGPDGRYRYLLGRRWGEGSALCWVMLNPSTADAYRDDPTIRRCIAFARAWGYGSISVVNLYPIRATSPREALAWAAEPDAEAMLVNARVRARAIREAAATVAAWGARAPGDPVREPWARGIRWLALGTTASGQPRHPLYVPASAPLSPWAR